MSSYLPLLEIARLHQWMCLRRIPHSVLCFYCNAYSIFVFQYQFSTSYLITLKCTSYWLQAAGLETKLDSNTLLYFKYIPDKVVNSKSRKTTFLIIAYYSTAIYPVAGYDHLNRAVGIASGWRNRVTLLRRSGDNNIVWTSTGWLPGNPAPSVFSVWIRKSAAMSHCERICVFTGMCSYMHAS